MLKSKALEWATAFEDGDEAERQRWCELHQSASDCFGFLFNEVREQVCQDLAETSGEVEIKVTLYSVSVALPWGLLCTPMDVPTSATAGWPVALWGNKYNLVVDGDICGFTHGDPNTDWSFVPVLCEDTFVTRAEALSGAERSLADHVCSIRYGPTGGHRSGRTSPRFLYVYSHADGDHLQFSSRGDINKRKPFDIISDFIGPGGVGVVILNACNTVATLPEIGASLMSYSPIEIASVVTEIKVHEYFALRFGLELVHRCVQLGESTHDAMRVMRVRHHPMSIVYSHYCLRPFKFQRPLLLLDVSKSQEYDRSIMHVNFSEEMHGTH